jgi:hypothetical protein
MNYLKTFLPYLFGNKKGKSLDILLPDPIPWTKLNFEETLMFHTLKNSLNRYIENLELNSLSKKEVFHLFNFFDYLNKELKIATASLYQEELDLYLHSKKSAGLNALEIQELLDFNNAKLSVFALLNMDRQKPGVLIVRRADGSFCKNPEGHIWSIPILGLSGRGLPFHHSNGCTPAGVFSLDSVMPLKDKVERFGKCRRLIVNFINPSPNEFEITKLLPSSHQQLHWWKPSVVARELGRNFLRIHGTGRQNLNPLTPYYPFFPTSGCLATNESEFFGLKKFQDQRLLLDALMMALDLPPTDENESKIHGLLYVVELDANLSTLKF